ncbi:SMI1/KNR4 family protein [Streptomyces sp. NBC_00620]|uniref:SMI1/KNR4 family protein n=1 Tax=unclassified Streptomyces TaxID=2593676 RepID=UPI002253CB01|nr:SMI1/KNR4 family protein [Streptomyces sp. NBC_00620]MCX4972031.1 SMI1/KNR4 family protein [Streptomyces sp. NBC_00620]
MAEDMLRVSDLERVVSELLSHRSPGPRGVNFEAISQILGVELPSDYRELADFYPTLEFDDFLRVPTPLPGQERAFGDGIFRELETLRDLQDDDMTEGYVAHPDPGGLIPWSESLSGDVFYWRISGGNSDDWPVVVNSRNDDWWEFQEGALAFLVGLIDGTIERRGLPDRIPGANPRVRVFSV